MSRRRVLRQFSARQRTGVVFTICLAVLLFQQGARALPQPSDALRFFNNYFVTGGYVVGSVGLWNTGAGTINMSSPTPPMTPAPQNADVLATYLYWQVVTTVDPDVTDIHGAATFNGSPLSETLDLNLPPTIVGLGGTEACLLNGGAGRRVYTFRADVQRFLDVDISGRRVISKPGGYPVSLPNDSTARTLGASLVMIYRHPDPATPLNAIVLYDGTFVKQQPMMLNQRIEGFYDPASVPGQITYIAGSAQSGLSEVLRIDTDGDPATIPAGTSSLFDGASGSAWDTVTRQTDPLTGFAQTGGYLDTSIAPQTTGPLGFLINDCVAMGAMIYQTQVNDGDADGLLDRWETSPVALPDPNGVLLPLFSEMGADPDVKDVFIEVAAMQAPAGTTYGSDSAPLRESLHSVTDEFGHIHVPTPAVLKMLGDEFAEQVPTIRLHFDVGHPTAYHALLPPSLPAGEPNPYASLAADDYIIGAGGLSGDEPAHARGGELIQETACEPLPGVVDCQFPEFPGTVSWKRGFALYKEAAFDRNRKDSFRFGLYAHAKATPKSLLPCLGESGPAGFDEEGNCESGAPNPLIHVPAGVSGTAEYPGGGDFLITLGLWDSTNFVGTDLGVATTTMHEFGHTAGLGHGGDALPNCKPNYLSVMNYLFQLGGLMDADGNPHLGYSEADYDDVNEDTLSESYSVPGLFRTAWYAPWSDGDAGTPAKRFCNGLKFPEDTPPMARVDGSVVGGSIDWNNDGDTADGGLSQDVNFDGEPDGDEGGPTTLLTGFNDWAAVRLNQVGSRRNFAGLSAGPLGVQFLADGSELLADGSKILADGSWLLADGSELLADGSVFLSDGAELLADGAELLADGSKILADGSHILADGSELLADGAVLLSDGSALLADGSVFLSDGAELLADGAVFLGDGVQLLADGAVFLSDGSPLLADGANLAWAWIINEPTPHSAAETGNTPGPHSLTASVIMDQGPNFHRIALDWEAPALGDVAVYRVYRAAGDSVTVTDENEIVASPVNGSMTDVIDTEELPNGQFTYVVVAVLDDEGDTVTPPSNQFTVTAVNDKPVADAQTVIVWEDWLSDPITVTGQDLDTSGLAFSGDFTSTLGTIAGVLPSVTYLSPLNYNGPDSFSFRLHELTTWNGQNQMSDPATVEITVTPVNDKPSFTHSGNQTVTQPAGAQTVGGWVTGFDAGPPDEDLTQGVAEYIIVSNTNPALFSVQPAVAANGTLTYTPAPGAAGSATISVRVRDNGGTAEGHGAVDTSDEQLFTITVNPPPATQISFQRTDLWLTTSTSNRKFNVKAQVLRGGVVIAEKEITGLTVGLGSSFSKAVYKQIQPLIPATSFGFTPQDTLSVRVLVKLSASSGGGNQASAEVRLWYNTPGNNSHLHATRAGTSVKYYMVTGFKLQTSPAQAAGGTQYVSVMVKKGDPYAVLGTWSITGP
jgi:hypothetical protein